jgi:hypothetical protein
MVDRSLHSRSKADSKADPIPKIYLAPGAQYDAQKSRLNTIL